jgi:hypothetical protein
MWMAWKMIIGVPHDIPIVGYGGLARASRRSQQQFRG